MKKCIAILLTCLLLTTAVFAVPATQQNAADALNHLGLFLGTNKGYELDAALTRAQGVTLLVRLLGAEEEAQKGTYTLPFTDVADWAKPYVGYAYTNKITNGVAADRFGSNDAMTDNMFLTLCLRALGHKDSGTNPAFTWDKPYDFARSVGLTDSAAKKAEFLRGDAVVVMWNTLGAKMADSSSTLANTLIKKGVFYQGYLDVATRIFEEGVILGGAAGDPVSDGGNGGGGSTSGGTDYEAYMAMSAAEKQAFRDTFGSTAAFFTWYHAALAEYEESKNTGTIGPDGVIDLGKEFGQG